MARCRGFPKRPFQSESAAPSAVPLSPAAGWMKTSRNGVLSRILPFSTLFMKHPPARHSRGLLVRAQSALRT